MSHCRQASLPVQSENLELWLVDWVELRVNWVTRVQAALYIFGGPTTRREVQIVCSRLTAPLKTGETEADGGAIWGICSRGRMRRDKAITSRSNLGVTQVPKYCTGRAKSSRDANRKYTSVPGLQRTSVY